VGVKIKGEEKMGKHVEKRMKGLLNLRETFKEFGKAGKGKTLKGCPIFSSLKS